MGVGQVTVVQRLQRSDLLLNAMVTAAKQNPISRRQGRLPVVELLFLPLGMASYVKVCLRIL